MRLLRSLVMAAVFAGSAAWAADAVIMPDGYIIEGRVFKEKETVRDAGRPVVVSKADGFDVIEDGPKYVIFSQHAQKGAKVDQGVLRPEVTAYKRPVPGTKGQKLPAYGEITAGEFDATWKRTLTIRYPAGGFDKIGQAVTYIDPYVVYLFSTTHAWLQRYTPQELGVAQVRKLLGTHPDLQDPPGVVDPMRRMSIAVFLKDAGWLPAARQEMARLKKDAPGDWAKDATDRFAKITDELDAMETRLVIDELEAAVGSGRYDSARKFLAGFVPKAADAKQNTRLAVLKAQIETVQPRYELARRLLRDILDKETGATLARAHAAVGGGPAALVLPTPKLEEPLPTLVTAAEAVFAELHPDTTSRIDLFVNLAEQAEKRAREGKDVGASKPANLLALAISGWLKGKNGADPNPSAAVRCWATRQLAVRYMKEESGNNRLGLLNQYQQSGLAVPPDELAQIITLLPPVAPENLDAPTGTKVPADKAGVDGVWRRATGPLPEDADGVGYYFRLPPEYYHGRSYPVLIALTHPTIPPEKYIAMLASFADKHGYVVAAPDWATRFSGGYDFDGKEHKYVTAVRRDLIRRFQVDPDKMFLFGFGGGADFAFDVAFTHPDLWAGVVAFGGSPPDKQFKPTAANCQKLPFFCVTGEMAGASFTALRQVFTQWMPQGYPSLLTMYKGRGMEWFTPELPRAFDWMGRKTRMRGTSVLALNQPVVKAWQAIREGEHRFYWVGTSKVKPGHTLAKTPPGQFVTPAAVSADIRRGNQIVVKAVGTRNAIVWLERDMIDWTKPVRVLLNDQPPYGFKPKVLEPDLHLMFEELYRTGDRKMLFLGRLEFDTPG